MRLDALSLTTFRNYARLEAAWPPEGALLWGDNGAGKTNVLEAIHLLAVGRSHRTRNDRELIGIGGPGFDVSGTGESDREGRIEIRVAIGPDGAKRASVGGKEEDRLSSLVGRLGAVMVAPEDMEVTRGAPERRRRFLDQLLCQMRPAHLAALQAYGRALRQRNAALRAAREGRGSPAEAEAWTEPLVTWGRRVREGRAALVGRLAAAAAPLFGEVSGGEGRLAVEYPAGEQDPADALRRVAALEARRGTTLAGPHRDDLSIELDGKDLRAYGSRGQQRAATFALKIASCALYREERGEEPILLLDDVFAELDRARGDRLGALLAGRGQVFAAATTSAELSSRFRGVSQYRVSAGAIAKGSGE